MSTGVRAQTDNLLKSGRLFHAVMFEGDNADENADYYARAAVCGKSGCGECSDCRKADAHTHPDIIQPQKSGKSDSYSIATIRQVKHDSAQLPNEANRKVYLFRGIDNMSAQSQNALLTVLEEPPEHVVFIFTCVQKSRVLDTVLSRVLVFTSNAPNAQPVQDKAQKICAQLCEALLGTAELTLLRISSSLEKDRALFLQVLTALETTLRAAQYAKYTQKYDSAELKSLALRLSAHNFIELLDAVRRLKHSAQSNASSLLCVTRLSALLRAGAGK